MHLSMSNRQEGGTAWSSLAKSPTKCCKAHLIIYIENALYKIANLFKIANLRRGRGRQGIGRDFDIFQKVAVKFPTPGQKCEIKYN